MLEPVQLPSLAALSPYTSQSQCSLDRLGWNPFSDKSANLPNPFGRSDEERALERDRRRAARLIRDRLVDSLEVSFQDKREQEVSAEADRLRHLSRTSPQNPFELYHQVRSERQSGTPNEQTIHENVKACSDSIPVLPKAPIDPLDTFLKSTPPPYTLYRRRAISLPLEASAATDPASSAWTASDHSCTKLPDEFEAVQHDADSSSPLIIAEACLDPGFLVNSGAYEEVSSRAVNGDSLTGEVESKEHLPAISTPHRNREEGKASVDERTAALIDSVSATRLSESLNTFLASRGRSDPTKYECSPAKVHTPLPTVANTQALTPELQLRPAPFDVPTFLFETSATRPSSLLRVVLFDLLLQRRSLCLALEQAGFKLVHRPSRYPTSRFTQQDPHLILTGTACTLYFKLTDLIGNAVRLDPVNSQAMRRESILATMLRFSERYDHMLVIFEEQQRTKTSTSVRPNSYTAVVLSCMNELAQAVSNLKVQGSTCSIDLVCSKDAEDSAYLTRRFADFVASRTRDENPATLAEGDSENEHWLPDDPDLLEGDLLRLSPMLNEVDASTLLTRHGRSSIEGKSTEELLGLFESVIGAKRIHRILASIARGGTETEEREQETVDLNNDSLLTQGDERLFPPASGGSNSPRELRFEDIFDVSGYEEG
ncbi:uncharacterized protein JCM15063_002697 [Sporobolomyces koalae]|uniref:uncharacterized protein n=1 Tax=Sporobolomyces koalae TaxID=500713 RepID=UPI00316BBDD9